MSTSDTCTVVVPCFNEESRLDEDQFLDFASRKAARLLFVDDGSTDGTEKTLQRMSEASEAIEMFNLETNIGKAEAVRRGLLLAVRKGASVVGYYDADLATPIAELERLIKTIEARPELVGVFGCRVARLGSSIKRSLSRHYFGRVYGTLASLALGVSVYDTQCGAKLFRVTPEFVAAIARPFRLPWSFDVELLDRLLRGSPRTEPVPVDCFLEVPLESWRDVEGSKITFHDAAAAFVDLISMAWRRTRRSAADSPVLSPEQWEHPAVFAPSLYGEPDEPTGRLNRGEQARDPKSLVTGRTADAAVSSQEAG